MKTLFTATRLIIIPLILSLIFTPAFSQPGSNDPTFNPTDQGFGLGDGANNTVVTSAIQSDGKTIIVGDFTSFNGSVRNRIARLNTDGTLDVTFAPGTGANSTIYTTAIQSDGKIIIGGDFTSYNGTATNKIARLNTNGTLDASFTPGTGADSYIFTCAIQTDGKIIIGGTFTSYNGTAGSSIARLNTNGTLDMSFGYATGANIQAITIQSDGKILIGGYLTSYKGTLIKSIARLNIDGTLDASFNPGLGANDYIKTISIQSDGKIIIGGLFTSFNGTVANYVARLNANGTLDVTFTGIGANGFVLSTVLQSDGRIVIGGRFISYNGTTRNEIARLNSNGTLDASFNPGSGIGSSSGAIETISLQGDGKLIIGGVFISYNGNTRSGITRLNTDATLDVAYNPGTGANNSIQAIAIQNDRKIVIGGGDVTSYNGVTINRIARLNIDGTLDTSFKPGIGPDINGISTISIQPDGKIIIGGSFTSYNGTSRNKIARLNNDGTLDASFNPGLGPTAGMNMSSSIYTTSIQTDGKIIIGGIFTSYNGIARNAIARLNTDGTLDTVFNPGSGPANNYTPGIYTIIIQVDGKIIIGGTFTSYNGSARNRIARLNTDGTLDGTFAPGTGATNTTTPDNTLVKKINLQNDGKIIIGGYFTSYNGTARNNIARVNTDGTLDASFNPGSGANDFIYATAIQVDGKIIIGGAFTFYNGTGRNSIARLNTDGSLDAGFNPGSGAPFIQAASLQSDGKIIIGGSFTFYNGTGRNRVARVLGNTPVSSTSDYFRTITSGNWNIPSTWETSPLADFSSGLASPATLTPDNNSKGITIRNGHIVTVTANVTTDHTIVNPLGVLTVTGSTLTVLNNGLTLKSDATGTARIGNSSGTISGNVIVERYIPANTNKAWRLLSVPVTGTQTINAAWQNGQNAGVAGSTGIGTIITGNNGNTSFDYQTLGNSMLTYNSSADKFSGIANTTSPIATDNGYFLFVRGDRTATPSNNLKTATTLSTAGVLKQGNYPSTPMSVTASQFGLIGNPYVSQLDFRNVTKSAGIDNTFYVWDPKLAGSYGLGAYQTLTLSGSNYIITPGGGSYGTSGSTMNTIESGQAFFVHATSTGTVSFTENTKSTGSNNVFRTSSTPAKSLITNLYSVESSGDELADGTMSLFDNNYSNSVDGMDALKLTNFGVNLGIAEDDKILSVEKRKEIKEGDVISFNLNNTKQQQYRFEFIVNGLNYSGLSASLIDNYLKTNTPVDLNGTTSVNFTITSDPASSAANRFSIGFGKPALVNTNPAIVIYPNPVNNGKATLQFNNMPKGIYNVRLLNSAGQLILNKQINHAEGSSTETINVNKIKGAYLLEITKPDNTKSLSKVIIN